MASARARLELALGDPSPPIAALLEHLEQREASSWAEAVLSGTLGRVQAVDEGPDGHVQSLSAKAAEHPEAHARLLLDIALVAVHLVRRWSLLGTTEATNSETNAERLVCSSEDAQLNADDLLDVACFLPTDWCELLVQAARILRGESPEDLDAEDQPDVTREGRRETLSREQIGGYHLLEPLGRGSFGAVYRAIDPDLDRQVALKLLRLDVFSKRAEMRFLEEGRILSSLSHSGIAVLYSAGFDLHLGIRLPYLAMELVPGLSIVRFAQENNLTELERLQLIVQACDALHHAHQNGVVHRDVHPGNLIVRADGILKVLDFGAAFVHTPNGSATRSGVIIGALAYISPEQACSSRHGVSERSDVFGLGAVLFELLSGETPHALGNLPLTEALSLVADGAPRRLLAVAPRANRDLDAICARALADDPEDRYGSALELGEDLRRFKAGLPVHARPPGIGYSMRRLALRHHRAIAVSVLGVIAVGVLGLVAAAGWRNARLRTGDAEASQAETNEMVLSVLEQADDNANKMGLSWDAEGFHRTWSEPLGSMQISDIEPYSVFLELKARYSVRIGDYDRSIDLRTQVLGIRRQLLSEVTETGGDTDAPTRDLSRAMVRLGDSHWTYVWLTGRAVEHSAEIDAKTELARDLFQRALDLDLALAQRSPKPGHLDDLVWSYIRLYDLELKRGHVSTAEDYLRQAENWSHRLLKLDRKRSHSHFARAEIGIRLFRKAWRDKDPKAVISHTEKALLHASFAYHAERDRLTFLRSYQSCLANIAVAISAESEILAIDGSLFRSLTRAQSLGSDVEAWYSASSFYVEVAKAAGRGRLHYLAGFLYAEAVRTMREAQKVGPSSVRWFDELTIARLFRSSAAEYELCDRPGLAQAARHWSSESIESVRSADVPPDLLALAEKLLFGSPPADPRAVLEEIELLGKRMRPSMDDRDEAIFPRLLETARSLCNR